MQFPCWNGSWEQLQQRRSWITQCDHSQELSGMWDPEITLAGALAPKDWCCFSLYNAMHKAIKKTSSRVSVNENTTHSRRERSLVCPWYRGGEPDVPTSVSASET